MFLARSLVLGLQVLLTILEVFSQDLLVFEFAVAVLALSFLRGLLLELFLLVQMRVSLLKVSTTV
jgi:hypothetical protein